MEVTCESKSYQVMFCEGDLYLYLEALNWLLCSSPIRLSALRFLRALVGLKMFAWCCGMRGSLVRSSESIFQSPIQGLKFWRRLCNSAGFKKLFQVSLIKFSETHIDKALSGAEWPMRQRILGNISVPCTPVPLTNTGGEWWNYYKSIQRYKLLKSACSGIFCQVHRVSRKRQAIIIGYFYFLKKKKNILQW